MGYVGFFFFNGKPFPCIWGINRPAHLHDMLGRQSNSLPSQGSDKAGLCSSLQFQPCTVEKKNYQKRSYLFSRNSVHLRVLSVFPLIIFTVSLEVFPAHSLTLLPPPTVLQFPISATYSAL